MILKLDNGSVKCTHKALKPKWNKGFCFFGNKIVTKNSKITFCRVFILKRIQIPTQPFPSPACLPDKQFYMTPQAIKQNEHDYY